MGLFNDMSEEERELMYRKRHALTYLQHKKTEAYMWTIGSLIMSVIFTLLCWRFYVVGEASGFVLFIVGAIAVICFLFFIGILIKDLPKIKQQISRAEYDIESLETEIETEKENQRKMEERQEEIREQQKAMKQQKYAYEHPECPMCKSHSTRKISTANRVVSVSLLGLASSKIGKQYECFKCGHKW